MTKLAPAQLAVIQLQAARYFVDLVKPNCSDRRRLQAKLWADANPRHRAALVVHARLWSFVRSYPGH
jgi:ferric-dicitrate binding protein FerR (iron transport regulator)